MSELQSKTGITRIVNIDKNEIYDVILAEFQLGETLMP